MPAPPAAAELFGSRLPLAEEFVGLLAGPGTEWGLIGPRERDRLWDRHVLNCAVLADLVPVGARIVDVGSGAGLPGLALACRRPDLRVDLVEPLLRRTRFLEMAVSAVGLGGQVRVVRGRAEDRPVRETVGDAAWCTARAVAPLEKLVAWCLPLLRSGGTLLAMKGERAARETQDARTLLRRLGADVSVTSVGADVLAEPVTVVVVNKREQR